MAQGEAALMAAAREIQSLRNRFKTQREKQDSLTTLVTDTAVMGAAGFVGSYAQARYPERMQVAKIPIDALLGVGIVAGSLAGVIPDEHRYVLSVGQGFSIGFLARKGGEKGSEAKDKDAQKK